METLLRAALIDWLRDDVVLAQMLNSVTEEASSRVSLPWLGLVASASIDWSTKTQRGREVRIALELHCRGDDPETAAALTDAVEARIEALPRSHPGLAQPGFQLVSIGFMRARAQQRPGNIRAVLLEYRFRILELSPTHER